MAKNPKKRQQKLERRKAKRKEKKHEMDREQSKGLPELLDDASKMPVLHAYMAHSLDDQGIGAVLISRQLPNRMVAFSSFMVDRFCLGVKDALSNISPRSNYEERMIRQAGRQQPYEFVSPAKARKFVEDAVTYAVGLGFQPHPDYQRAKLIFGDIDPNECTEEFEFGKDGKPFYINGPYDTPQRIQFINNTLTDSCGPDGFKMLFIGGPPPSEIHLEDSDEDEDLDYDEDESDPNQLEDRSEEDR